jgi:hypothetical protein
MEKFVILNSAGHAGSSRGASVFPRDCQRRFVQLRSFLSGAQTHPRL